MDGTAYVGSIACAAVSMLWEFTTSGYQIGTQGFVAGSMDAIANTGTTFLLLPQSVA